MIETIRKNINKCFPKKPKPTYSLIENIRGANFGQCPEFNEDWKDWTEISNELIAYADLFFTEVPTEYAPYFIPRFMLFVLDEISAELPAEYMDSCAGSRAVAFVLENQHKDYVDLQLSAKQKSLLNDFLTIVLENEDYKMEMVCAGLIIDHGMDLPPRELWDDMISGKEPPT